MVAGLVTGVGLCLAACGGPTQVSGQSPLMPGSSGDPGTSVRGSPDSEPFATPSDYKDKNWTFKPDPQNGGSGAYVTVPQGWKETKRADYWSDFLDPTGQVRLRVDVTAGLTGNGLEQSPQAAATAESTRLKSAASYKPISQRAVTGSGQITSGYELVYQFSLDGAAVQSTYRFVGDGDITEAVVAIYYPAAEQEKAEQVLDKVQDSLQFAG